jgi:hypothetical protein
MVYFNSLSAKLLWALIGAAALATAMPARADSVATATASSVTLIQSTSVTPTFAPCDGLSGDEARHLAQQARRDGSYRKAAECFRVAGDLVQADRSTIRASADTGAAATRKVAANIESAKSQARRLRAAFR